MTAPSIKAGKDNVTTNSPGLFGCKKIYFQHPFHGKQQVKIFASFGHNIGSSGHRYGGAVWVESVSTSGFTACVLEFGDGSNSTSEINWLALQSVPLGTQSETVHLNAWTTGKKCTTIKFKQVRFLRSTWIRQLWQMNVSFFSIKKKARLGLITFPSLRLKSQFSEIFTTFEERISDINDLFFNFGDRVQFIERHKVGIFFKDVGFLKGI